MPATASQSYTGKDIVALEGLDPVRRRPGMYIGGVSSQGLHHLVWEVVDNSVDEAMNGNADTIQVTLHKDGSSVTVTDNGRGIPVDMHPKLKKSTLEVVLCTLHAGGKFEGKNYKTSGGLHGVGSSVVNALSKEMTAIVKRDGNTYEMTFKQGKPTSKLKKKAGARGTGTTITFHPDPQIFPNTTFSSDTIRERLEITSYLHKGLKIVFTDETARKTHTFSHDDGITDYLQKIVKERSARLCHDQLFSYDKDNGMRMELVLGWTEATEEHVRSYVNGIPTGSGGSHENGFRAGLTKAVRNYISTHNLTPRGITLATEDIREGLYGVLSLFHPDPQFQGQTKDRLNNADAQGYVDGAVRPALEQWMNTNPTVANIIVARIIQAARAREASRAAVRDVARKTATSANRLNLPGKLSDCTDSGGPKSELFIVEGDSAGGSAKQGRDRSYQAILPLRGKVLNAEQASISKVLDNKELSDIVTALGCGMGRDFNPARLRYGKVILLMDADSDGHHIATLLLTFLYRHMRGLIDAGKVYLACPPLYRIDIGKATHWAADDEDRARILKENTNSRSKPEITRFKGLGEMMPKVLWQTTLNPDSRRLLQVAIEDPVATDRTINELMGKDPGARFTFIMDRADEADDLDV